MFLFGFWSFKCQAWPVQANQWNRPNVLDPMEPTPVIQRSPSLTFLITLIWICRFILFTCQRQRCRKGVILTLGGLIQRYFLHSSDSTNFLKNFFLRVYSTSALLKAHNLWVIGFLFWSQTVDSKLLILNRDGYQSYYKASIQIQITFLGLCGLFF